MPDSPREEKEPHTGEPRIISLGRVAALDIDAVLQEPFTGRATEYDISELARYLLNPAPIRVDEKVIGCKIFYRSARRGLIRRIRRKEGNTADGGSGGNTGLSEEILSTSKIGAPTFADEQLNRHFTEISKLLQPYDPVYRALLQLDSEQIDDIKAVCEEIGGSRYTLNLKGSINEKIHFILNSLSKKTKVLFSRAYLSSGLFEMRALSSDLFSSGNRYRLLKLTNDNKNRYCVLNSQGGIDFWVDDEALVGYLQIFELSIRVDPKLESALRMCEDGRAVPLKLFFSKKLEKGYSEKRLPHFFRAVFNTYEVSQSDRNMIIDILNNYQSVVFFNYLPVSDDPARKILTNISVMHDIRAFAPLKSQLPQVYSELDKKTAVSDAGRLYLLDSIMEYQNV